jgi:hypothetical protein
VILSTFSRKRRVTLLTPRRFGLDVRGCFPRRLGDVSGCRRRRLGDLRGCFRRRLGDVIGCFPGRLGDVEGVEHEHVVVVLGERDHVSLGRDLEAAAATHLHVGTLELPDERPVAHEHGHVEAVAVAVSHQHVTRVTDVDSVRVVGDVLTPDTAQELAVFTEHHHTVALQNHQ